MREMRWRVRYDGKYIVSNWVMSWSNIYIILAFFLPLYYLIHFIIIFRLLFLPQALENVQTLSFAVISLLLFQITEKHSSLLAQAVQNFLVMHSWGFVLTVYKLTSSSIWAVSLVVEFVAAAGFVLGGQEVTRTYFLISVSKITLNHIIHTLSLKGHSIPFFQYLHTFIAHYLPRS